MKITGEQLKFLKFILCKTNQTENYVNNLLGIRSFNAPICIQILAQAINLELSKLLTPLYEIT
jgi:hypothetical protein